MWDRTEVHRPRPPPRSQLAEAIQTELFSESDWDRVSGYEELWSQRHPRGIPEPDTEFRPPPVELDEQDLGDDMLVTGSLSDDSTEEALRRERAAEEADDHRRATQAEGSNNPKQASGSFNAAADLELAQQQADAREAQEVADAIEQVNRYIRTSSERQQTRSSARVSSATAGGAAVGSLPPSRASGSSREKDKSWADVAGSSLRAPAQELPQDGTSLRPDYADRQTKESLRRYWVVEDGGLSRCVGQPFVGIREDLYGRTLYVTRDPAQVRELLGPDSESVIKEGKKARRFGIDPAGLMHSTEFAHSGKDLRRRPPSVLESDGSPWYYAVWWGSCPETDEDVKRYVTTDYAVLKGLYNYRFHQAAKFDSLEGALEYLALGEEEARAVTKKQNFRPNGCGWRLPEGKGGMSHGDGTSLFDTHNMLADNRGGWHLGSRRGLNLTMETADMPVVHHRGWTYVPPESARGPSVRERAKGTVMPRDEHPFVEVKSKASRAADQKAKTKIKSSDKERKQAPKQPVGLAGSAGAVVVDLSGSSPDSTVMKGTQTGRVLSHEAGTEYETQLLARLSSSEPSKNSTTRPEDIPSEADMNCSFSFGTASVPVAPRQRGRKTVESTKASRK